MMVHVEYNTPYDAEQNLTLRPSMIVGHLGEFDDYLVCYTFTTPETGVKACEHFLRNMTSKGRIIRSFRVE